jgi:rubrerythrin
MDIEEAIETAIGYEKRIRDIYRQASSTCNDETGVKIFSVLADEEQGHLDYLRAKLVEWRQTGTVTPRKMHSSIPSGRVAEKSLDRVSSGVSGIDCTRDLELLERALEMEKETSGFYEKMVSELDAEGQRLFGPFIDIELGHLKIVQAEIDNLRGLGYWFDFQEFDLEAG